MNIIEDRKYFDYELAYDGYKRAEELFDKGGIEELVNDGDFVISGGGLDYIGTIEQWTDSGYIPIIANAYNISLSVEKEEDKWYLSNVISVLSYGFGEDLLNINDVDIIEDRISGLKNFADDNDYSMEDYINELESLLNVLKKINF